MFRFKERSKCFASKMKEKYVHCTKQKKRNKSQNKKMAFRLFSTFLPLAHSNF